MKPSFSQTFLTLALCGGVVYPSLAQDPLIPEPLSALEPLSTLEPLLPNEPMAAGNELLGASVGDVVPTGSIEPIMTDAAGPSSQDLEMVAKVSQEALPSRFSVLGGVGVYRESNIYLSHADHVADSGMQYSGKLHYLAVDRGKLQLGLDTSYSSVSLFDHPELNGKTIDGSLKGMWEVGRNKVNFNGDYTYATGVDRHIGTVDNRTMQNYALDVSRELGAKTTMRLMGRYSGSSYQALLSNQDLMARASLDYQLGGRTRLGLAFAAGTLTTKENTDAINLQSGNSFSQLSISREKQMSKVLAQQTAEARQAADDQVQQIATVLEEEKKFGTSTPERIASLESALDAAKSRADEIGSQDAAAGANAKKQARRSTETPDQSYYQALVTANYEATGKLMFTANGGLDMRRYSGSEAAESSKQYTFSLTANYLPREKTKISLTATKATVGAISLQGTSIDRTVISLGAEQKIGDKLTLTYTGSFETDDYKSIRTDVSVDRSDTNMRHRAELDYSFTKNIGLRVFYEFDVTDSKEELLTYDNHRYGIQLGISF